MIAKKFRSVPQTRRSHMGAWVILPMMQLNTWTKAAATVELSTPPVLPVEGGGVKVVIMDMSPAPTPFPITTDANRGDSVCMKYCPHPNCMAQSRTLLAFEADRKGGAAPRVDARAHSARTCID